MEEILQYLTANSNTPIWFVIMIFVIAFILLIMWIDKFYATAHYKLDLKDERKKVTNLEYEVDRKEGLLRESIKEVNVLRDTVKRQNQGLTTLEAPQEESKNTLLSRRGKSSPKSTNPTGKA